MSDILDLKGRTALVTGAGQGVGRQTALHFAAHNAATVVINDYYTERAEAVAAEIAETGAKAVALGGDVSDFDSVMEMFARAEGAAGGIDILVNNAGNAGPENMMRDPKPFWETGPDEWADYIGANFNGVLNCCRAALPGMVERNYGRIVTVISDAARVGEPHLAVYSGAKAGAGGFMRAIAKAGARWNVAANCVALGSIDTPGVQGLMPDEETRRRIVRLYLIRRLGEPDDAANMILFLASDASSWVTGQTYPVNGGYSFAV